MTCDCKEKVDELYKWMQDKKHKKFMKKFNKMDPEEQEWWIYKNSDEETKKEMEEQWQLEEEEDEEHLFE